jgi:lysophospholipid acyltransferase (LPLAT)-like uncharacterized protein
MVSHGRIGTLGTYLLNLWDIECVAGSGPRRGIDAVQELTRKVQEQHRSVLLMADGSRGPPHRARWGAIHLARDTGLPILAARAWGDNLVILERTWMRLVLPRPWGRAVVLSADPLLVPADARDRGALDRHRLELEARLASLVAHADAWLAEGGREGCPALTQTAVPDGPRPATTDRATRAGSRANMVRASREGNEGMHHDG